MTKVFVTYEVGPSWIDSETDHGLSRKGDRALFGNVPFGTVVDVGVMPDD